jgi:hypothetical protein
VTLDSPKTSEGGNGSEVLALTRSLTPASTSPLSSPLSVGPPRLRDSWSRWENQNLRLLQHVQHLRRRGRAEDQP